MEEFPKDLLVKKASVAVDLDGCLAYQDTSKPFDPTVIGKPVPGMLRLVKLWIRRGKDVVIFTARAQDKKNIPHVKAWLKENGLEDLEITNKKTPEMEAFYDDKAVRVEKNTGIIKKVASTTTISSESNTSSDPASPAVMPSSEAYEPDLTASKPNTPTVPSEDTTIPTTGPESIAYALGKIDLDKVRETAMSDIRSGKKTRRPDAVRMLGYLEGFKRSGLHPEDLVLHSVPVIPPKFRPFSVSGDVFIPGSANELYRDLINVRDSHTELEKVLGEKGAASHRLGVYDAVKAVYGYGEPTSPKTRERAVSGFLRTLIGQGSPKGSFIQAKMISKNMDYVGRGVIGVDPNLGMDEIGIPMHTAWKLYAPHIQRRLVRSGIHPIDAVKMIKDKDPRARQQLEIEAREHPLMYSRAPSWHRFSVIGGYPKLIEGNAVMINPFVGTGLGADHDGDAINVHLPSTPEAVNDIKTKLLPSCMLFSIKDPDKVVPVPKQENILGMWTAQNRPAKHSYTFPSEAAALKAVHQGKVSLSDEVKISG
jgi:DNA-directed RNA polymerase beta' subunit